MKKLWQKNWEMDKTIEAFETRGDLQMDQKLAKADVYGSLAHAKMLQKIGIISLDELASAKKGLQKIMLLESYGQFQLEKGDEDVHTKIENYLTKEVGDVGQKIHTGRSRNDQVLTALRLYTKEMLLQIWNAEIKLQNSFLAFVDKFGDVPMPGYTHMQKAMPSTVGMWAASFTESIADDLEALEFAYSLNDKSPLGSAAGYGVPLSLDRPYTAKLLGFSKVQISPIYCQNSRGKVEASILSALNSALLTINKFASDILFFTTSECNYFEVKNELCSGSSIMPQKKNVDIAELLRSKANIMTGNYVSMAGISSNLISGYNRDLQDTKKILIESLELALESVLVADILINNISPNIENLEKALTPEIFATHSALSLVEKGVMFRQAYQTVGLERNFEKPNDLKGTLARSSHLGGAGNLALDSFIHGMKKSESKMKKEIKKYEIIINNLLKENNEKEK
jgi:argininosuccinate lyase